MTTHVMLDLETYGVNPGCPVLAIGAHVFKHDGPLLESYTFYEAAKVDQAEWGLVPEDATVKWWSEQSEQARAIFSHADALPLHHALVKFADWLPKNAILWGNGAGFDPPILAAAYRAVEVKLPWVFWNERCYRTIKAMAPDIILKRTGTHHNALDDAVSQSEHLLEIAQKLGLVLA